jgi:hypothetical protein
MVTSSRVAFPGYLFAIVAAFGLSGCPKPVVLSDLKVDKLELSIPEAATRFCPEQALQFTVTITDQEGKSWRTWRHGERQGGHLRYEDFILESNMGTIAADGSLHLASVLETLDEELVVTARPAGPTGPGTPYGEWVRAELRLAPRYDCLESLHFDGLSGGYGPSGSTGAAGMDGDDGKGEPDCTAGLHGGAGSHGGNGGNGGSAGDGEVVNLDFAVAASHWRHRVVVLRVSRVQGDPQYFVFEPERLAGLRITAGGGHGGSGGDGGAGGSGGDGGDAKCSTAAPGNGGSGGDGGDGGVGGDGGHGGRLSVTVPADHPDLLAEVTFSNQGGAGGHAGQGGSAGSGGRAGSSPGSSGFPGSEGRWGQDGQPGRNGQPGPPVTITPVEATENFAEEVKDGLILR